MNEKYLVIVESPTKARTIKRFLPNNFIVEASIGHIRDLPQSAADIPASKKNLEWAKLGVNIENNFEPLYITPKGKGKIIQTLKRVLKETQALYLATDEDREGESISWHLIQMLMPEKQNIPVKRMVFHEITKKAIANALKHTRDIDLNLVSAQEARRILDRLYGFTLSPLIWKKIAYGLSAGRVQSPGLRLIVEREKERSLFNKAIYWNIKALLSSKEHDSHKQFEAKLTHLRNVRLATGKDFHHINGTLINKNVTVLGEKEAKQLEKDLKNKQWQVTEITEKESSQSPAPPLTTSTLQQEGNRKLGLSARETMRLAQRLYEEGLITYMRTDSITLSNEAITGARNIVEKLFGTEYLSKAPRQYSTKSKNAQEAHEAIRPSGINFVHPKDIHLNGKELALYEIIWKRTLATQMANAKKSTTSIKITVDHALFQANGTKILFPGFLKLYVEGSDDNKKNENEQILPNIEEGNICILHTLQSIQHETRPPTRYTEANLIQTLEKKGIGRPSTYSSIIGTLFDRKYVRKTGSALVPSFTGMAVIQFLEKNFSYLIEYNFTSEMEEALDRIAIGEVDRISYLKQFYLGKEGLKYQSEQREQISNADESRRIILPQAKKDIEIRVGRFGPYIIASGPNGENIHTSIPEDIAPSDLHEDDINNLIEIQMKGPEALGIDPQSQTPIFCLSGRYGFYIQLGRVTEDNPKPRRASIPKGINPKEVTLEDALKYLSIPRVLGIHPETGKEITASIGRFGAFIVHDDTFRSLKKNDDVYTITIDRALELLNEKKISKRNNNVIREIGTLNKKKVMLYKGKYGPYVKYGTKNISLPENKKDENSLAAISIEDIKLLLK